MKSTLLKLLPIFLVTFFGSGCAFDMGEEEAETSVLQQEVSCSGGCCGTDLNCSVPDRDLRSGCGGARIRNPETNSCLWPLTADADRSIYDGKGNRMGEVRSDAVKLNQGIRKKRDGRWYAYAFNTTVRMTDGQLRPFSGWIRQSDLRDTSRLFGYKLALGNPGQGHYRTPWKIVGGDTERYGRLFLHGTDGHPYPAMDYLLRPYGFVHLTYNIPGFSLGGHATDSFQPGAIFRRAKGVNQIEIPLYGPKGHRSKYSLHFAYGYVHDGESRRYGWIAKEALEAMPIPEESCGENTCWAKCSNRDAYHAISGVTSGCTDEARAFCSVGDRGAFQDAEWSTCRPN